MNLFSRNSVVIIEQDLNGNFTSLFLFNSPTFPLSAVSPDITGQPFKVIPTLLSIEQKLNFSLLTSAIESMVMTTKLYPNG